MLLAVQVALIAARVSSSGSAAMLGAPLGVLAAALVLAAGNRRLAADPHLGTSDRYVSAAAPEEFARGVCALPWLVLTIKGRIADSGEAADGNRRAVSGSA